MPQLLPQLATVWAIESSALFVMDAQTYFHHSTVRCTPVVGVLELDDTYLGMMDLRLRALCSGQRLPWNAWVEGLRPDIITGIQHG